MSEEKQAPRAAVGTTTTAEDPIQRRGFFRWLALGWLTFAAATGGFFTVIIRFLYPNVLFEPPQTFKIGLSDDGQILVDKTKSYKWEKGEWENKDSFLKV